VNEAGTLLVSKKEPAPAKDGFQNRRTGAPECFFPVKIVLRFLQSVYLAERTGWRRYSSLLVTVRSEVAPTTSLHNV
jgi:hypothetical protein